MKQYWPAPERTRQPVLEVLEGVLPAQPGVLEIASGSGQHAAFFTAQKPDWSWQPSDFDPHNLESVAGWVSEASHAGARNLRAPRRIDVCELDWGIDQVDAMFCANMIHIAPWACCLGLFAGAARYLRPGGVLVLYGPFRVDGAHTAASNAEFDASLKARDPSWGVRDCAEVAAVAESSGMSLIERVAMPANNQCLVFERT